MNSLQIHDGRGTADIEEIFAHASVASSSALLTTHMGESVFDADTLADTTSALRCSNELAKTMLKSLVLSDVNRTSM